MTLLKHEIRDLTRSPVMWVITGILFLLMALFYFSLIESFINHAQSANITSKNPQSVSLLILPTYFSWLGLILSGIVPFFVIRQYPRIQQLGVWDLLRLSPVKKASIVLQKFLALCIVMTPIVALLSALPLTMMLATDLDYGLWATNALGMTLMVLLTMSICSLFASISKSYLLTLVGGYGFLILTKVLQLAASSTNSEIFYYLSAFTHQATFMRGIINSPSVLYFIIFICANLYLSAYLINEDNLHQVIDE